jgi:hypothetical protein
MSLKAPLKRTGEQMKSFLTAATLYFLCGNSYGYEFQLGVVLGAPTGISAKATMEQNRSIDAVLAYSLADHHGLEFHVDYLVEKARTFSIKGGGPLELYYGIGAHIVSVTHGRHDGDTAFGPRAPIGLAYQINNPNVEFFGELALAFDISPSTTLDLEGGIGLRYRF